MKLFAKYNRINVVLTVIIFLLGSMAFTFLLRYVIISQVDEDLKIEKNEIITYLKKNHHLPSVIEVHDQYTTYKPIQQQQQNVNKIYTHSVFDEDEREKELQRTIQFTVNADSVWYLVNVSKSLADTDELIQTIIAITLAIILLILAATFFINRFVLRRLWQPFYTTLQNLQQFSINKKEKLNFPATAIDEFSYLNTTLENALNKAQNDYQTLKEFTENASHELQTPLAVIQSKLDILIQNEKLSENESQAIQGAYIAVQNLSKLNQSLLLLAKIENKQFSEQKNIDVAVLLQSKINQFSELWKGCFLATQTNLSEKIIMGNNQLIEILLNNLLSNATRHNVANGSINILLNDALQITNTGINHALNEKLLYKRFSKQNNVAESYGLGLSIIGQICEASNYTCNYKFNEPNLHSFIISW